MYGSLQQLSQKVLLDSSCYQEIPQVSTSNQPPFHIENQINPVQRCSKNHSTSANKDSMWDVTSTSLLDKQKRFPPWSHSRFDPWHFAFATTKDESHQKALTGPFPKRRAELGKCFASLASSGYASCYASC